MSLAAYARPADEADALLHREAPHNIELEQALLGCILLNSEILNRLPDYLKPEHFFAPLHRRLFQAMTAAKARDQMVSALTLKTQFENDPDFREVGGLAYLQRLAEDVPSVRNTDQFAKLIHDLATRRKLIEVGEAIVNDAYDAPLDYTPQEQVEAAEKALYGIADPAKRGGGIRKFGAAASVALEQAEAARRHGGKVTGVSSGLTSMDDKLGGFQKSDLIILAGRPGMGKTALALNFAVNAARAKLAGRHAGGTVAFFSLEMSAEQLAVRVLSEDSRISGWHIRHGKVDKDQFPGLIDSVERLEELPLYIDDSPGLSVSQVMARCRRMQRDPKIGLDMVVIDYLQLLEGSGGKRYDNRVQEITDITKNLKGLAKELNIPVIACSQLNRGVDSRDDRRPVLSDLRESGSIEQDADVVMFVYREEYYLATRKPDATDAKKQAEWDEKMARAIGKAECIIEKHRHGETGVVQLSYAGQYSRFGSLTDDDDIPEKRG
jgi:replicative DNA helicase